MKSSKRDRKLGDSWTDWQGETDPPEKVRTGTRLFLSLLAVSISLLVALGAVLLYLISPRLAQYSPVVPKLLGWCLLALAALGFLWLLFFLLVDKKPTRLFCLCLGNRFFFELSSLASSLGKKLGISQDRVGHSFIKVSNALMLASVRANPRRRILVLLPRCLAKEARRQVLSICSRYRVLTKTVGGGEEARRTVQEEKPEAVVGIACERDLVSGIRDVAPRIPVVGIPNIRPLGPCKGTLVNCRDLEDALDILHGESPAGPFR